jgi:uncharacterized Tic20 family protein
METSRTTLPTPQIVGATSVPTAEERTWALGAHLGTIVIYFLAPLIVMLTKGKESGFVRAHAVESLNFQLTLIIALCVAAALSIVGIGLVLMPLIAIAALVLIVIASIRAYQGEKFRYPVNIRFIS